MTVSLTAYLRACHCGPTVTVTVVGTALAAGSGRPWPQVVLVAVAVFAGQLSIGWSNDWIDAARDDAAGRVDKPIPAGEAGRRGVGVAAVVALAAAVLLSVVATSTGWAHVVAVAAGWWYNVHAKRTVLSPLPFALAFGLLVVFATVSPSWQMVAAGALLGVSAHITNVLPDLADDAATGVHGFPHRLGARGATAAALACLAAATGLLLTVFEHRPYLVGALAVVGLVSAALSSRRRLFLFVQLAALVNVAVLLWTTSTT